MTRTVPSRRPASRELDRPDPPSPAPAVSRRLRIDLSPLRGSRELRLLFLGGGISFAGSMLTFVALPYQAYRLSHSSLIVGLLSLAELIPLLVTAFIGGALADAVDRRRMLRLTKAGMCVVGDPRRQLASGASRAAGVVCRLVLFAALDGLQRPSLDGRRPAAGETGSAGGDIRCLSRPRSQFGMVAAPARNRRHHRGRWAAAHDSLDVASFLVSLVALSRPRAVPPPSGESDLSLEAIRQGLAYAWQRKDLLGTSPSSTSTRCSSGCLTHSSRSWPLTWAERRPWASSTPRPQLARSWSPPRAAGLPTCAATAA